MVNRPHHTLAALGHFAVAALPFVIVLFDHSKQRVAILTGAGDWAFSAGADVRDLPELWRCVPTVGILTEKRVIAAVPSWCIGGGLVMAMMCDLLVAAESAKFFYPKARSGSPAE